MPTPLLPKLHSTHNVEQFTEPGEWFNRSADELKNISEGLDVNSQVQSQINSIPDIWARPLLFEMALFNDAHPLHQQIMGEWRGLLAMIALREVKNLIQLTARLVEVKDNAAQPDFLRALHRLRPSGRSVSQDTNWEHLYLFLYQVGHLKSPIGMTSPTTLVFTSSHYANHINQNEVSWFDGSILQDPISRLSNQEKKALYGWINELRGKLAGRVDQMDAHLWNRLAGLLNAYLQEIGVTGSFTAGATHFGIQGVAAGVFIHLNTPAAAPAHAPSESHIRLINSADRSPATPMLIVDRNIAAEWGESPADIVVSGAATLASIPQNGLIQPNQIGSFMINNAQLWRPDELLTQKLYVIRQKEAFTGTKKEEWIGNSPVLGNDAISIILPLNDKLLEYLNEDDLLQRLKFYQEGGGEITVTLDLPLSGNGVHTSYKFRKTYPREDIVDFEKVPILEVFPNFKSANWHAYFIAYSADNPRATFKVKPVAPHAQEAKISVHGNPNAERFVWRLDSYPQALVCYDNQDKAGLLFLSAAQPPPPANRNFTVGIDFGASGTTVYKSFQNDKQPVEFKNRKLIVTAVDPAQSSQVFDFFLPNRDIPTPFLSFFQVFNNHVQNAVELEPLLNGHTYYTDDERLGELQSQQNIETNLKWSSGGFERLCAKAFLSQICLQTAAELVSEGALSIDWRFSYPTAFSGAHTLAFRQVCQQIATSIQNLTGVHSNLPLYNTESVAAAAFFENYQNAQTVLGTIFVDIGSSTSDISVWQKNTLLWQISLPFAGQDIFLNYLYSNKSIRQKFELPEPQNNDNSDADREHFYAAAAAVLRKESEQIFARLPLIANQEDVDKLKNHLALGLSGLFYYIGLGIRCLRNTNRYEEAEMPHFYLGGNGSQIFRWLTNGSWVAENNPYNSLFESVFKKAVNEDLNNFLKIEMSSLPKKEAAYGLVCSAILTVPDNSHKIVFAGENFKENNNSHKWDEVIDADVLTDSLTPPDKLEKLSDFVAAFNEFARTSNGQIKSFDFNEQKIANVRSRLANDLAHLAYQRAQQQEVIVQPIFVLALKHLFNA
jgi:hypothetical protein